MTAPKENKKQPPTNAGRIPPSPLPVHSWAIRREKPVIPPYVYDKDFVEFFKKVPPPK